MNFDDFTIKGTKVPCHALVGTVEVELGTRMPAGYREFLAHFGEGVLADYVRVYPPRRVADPELSAWRARIDEYWFWDAGREVLPKSRALECIPVADTMNGDEVVMHPDAPDTLYVLPRHAEHIPIASTTGLQAALEWLLSSGELIEPIADRNFYLFDR